VSQIGEQVVVLSRHPGGNIMTSYKSSVSSGCVAAPLAPPSGEDAQYAYPRRLVTFEMTAVQAKDLTC